MSKLIAVVAALLLLAAPAVAENAPDTFVVTGLSFEQMSAGSLLITPPGQAQTTLGAALASGCSLSGCTMSGPLVNNATGTAISAPNGNVVVGTTGAVQIGPMSLTDSGGQLGLNGGLVATGTIQTTNSLGILLNAPSNNSINAAGTQNISFGNLTNGNLFFVLNDSTTNAATCAAYAEGSTGYAKLSSIGAVPCTLRIDSNNPTIGASSPIVFGLGTDVVDLTLDAASNSVNGLEIYGETTGVAPQIQAAGTDTNIGIALVPKGTGVVTVGGGVELPGTTVASLPTCAAGNKGLLEYVTDATAPSYNGALTGGGTVAVPVFCNGSAWTAH